MSNTIIPFDSGRAYVVRYIPVEREKYAAIDSMGRTHADREFIEQFESIFYAAAKGELEKCKSIVEKGFHDFQAYSIGKFQAANGRSLDYLSPERVAEANKHKHITDYFTKVIQDIQTSPQLSISRIIIEGNVAENTREFQMPSRHSFYEKNTEALIGAIERSDSDKKLCRLIDKIRAVDDTARNPFDSLLSYEGPNPENAVKKMAEKYPVSTDHLMFVIQQEYSSETVALMLKKAVEDEGLDTVACIHWVLDAKYPEEIIFEFFIHASEFDYRSLYKALGLKLSPKTLEVLVERLVKKDDKTWVSMCRSAIIAPNQAMEFIEKKHGEFIKSGGKKREDDAFLKYYCDLFKDKPKPYLPYLTPIPSSLFKKITAKCFDFFPSNFEFIELLGQVEEEVIRHALEHSVSLTPVCFEQVLLYGYSDELVLDLCDRFKSNSLDPQILKIAELRDYSQAVFQKLQERCKKV